MYETPILVIKAPLIIDIQTTSLDYFIRSI